MQVLPHGNICLFLMQNEALLGVITLLHVSPGATSRTVKKKKKWTLMFLYGSSWWSSKRESVSIEHHLKFPIVQISSVIVVVISVKCYCLWIQPTTILMLTLKRGLFYFGSLPLLPTARNAYSFATTTKLIHLFICFFDLFASFLLQA